MHKMQGECQLSSARLTKAEVIHNNNIALPQKQGSKSSHLKRTVHVEDRLQRTIEGLVRRGAIMANKFQVGLTNEYIISVSDKSSDCLVASALE